MALSGWDRGSIKPNQGLQQELEIGNIISDFKKNKWGNRVFQWSQTIYGKAPSGITNLQMQLHFPKLGIREALTNKHK